MDKEFQDTFCYQTRLSEIRKHHLDFYDFKKIFGFTKQGFDIYADDIKFPTMTSVVLEFNDSREGWEKSIDKLISRYGDVRICWHKARALSCDLWDECLHAGDTMYKKARIAFEALDIYEYPDNDQILELPVNTAYCYVTSRYCNGIVNYLEDIHAYMIDRYTSESDSQEERTAFNNALKEIEEASDKDWYHTDLGKYCPDNVIVMGRTEGSWVMIWYDQDVSDCIIYRFSKDRFDSIEEFNTCVKLYLENMCLTHYNVYKLRDPKGFIKF